MTWVLILWIYIRPGQPIAAASAEFNSHKACVQAARSLQANFGQSSGFLCLEKGDAKDDLKTKGRK